MKKYNFKNLKVYDFLMSDGEFVSDGNIAIKSKYATTNNRQINELIESGRGFRFYNGQFASTTDTSVKKLVEWNESADVLVKTALLIETEHKIKVRVFKGDGFKIVFNEEFVKEFEKIGDVTFYALDKNDISKTAVMIHDELIGVIMPITGRYIRNVLNQII